MKKQLLVRTQSTPLTLASEASGTRVHSSIQPCPPGQRAATPPPVCSSPNAVSLTTAPSFWKTLPLDLSHPSGLRSNACFAHRPSPDPPLEAHHFLLPGPLFHVILFICFPNHFKTYNYLCENTCLVFGAPARVQAQGMQAPAPPCVPLTAQGL